MIYNSVEVLALSEFLKLYFRMCNIMNNYIPVRRWFHDEDEEEQCGFGCRDDMMAQFKQDLYDNLSLFKIKVKMIQLVVSGTELNFG